MIYLLRHGEIEMGPVWRFVGQIDLPLTETGVKQARWWRDNLAQTPFDRIHASDLERSRQTAGIVAEAQSPPVQTMTELREIDLGQWDGLTREEIGERFPDQWEKRGGILLNNRLHGGESFADLQARVVTIYEHIIKQPDANVLIVSHAGVNRVILCHILGMPLEHLFRLDQGYGALNIIEYMEGNPRMIAFNRLPFKT